MKIVFLVSSIHSKSNGLGGHYHSLLDIANQISKEHEIVIIDIGDRKAKALSRCIFRCYFVIDKRIRLGKILRDVLQILSHEKPDVLHSFDSLAYYWTRLAGKRLGIPYCLTKCGGKNPIYYPYCETLVLFSLENYLFFKDRTRYGKMKLFFIPNRISRFNDDYERIDSIHKLLGKADSRFKFLRISRIGNYYQQSSIQLINLINRLNDDGYDCIAIFVGVVEDKSCLDVLKSLGRGNCYFLTEEKYAKNARELMSLADAILGTGRSFMEAASKGKVLFSPLKASKYPVLISRDNISEAFYYNFSERTKISNHNEADNYERVKQVVGSRLLSYEYEQFALDIFREFFDANEALTKYNGVYNGLRGYNIEKYGDLLLHTLYMVRERIRK